MLDGFGSAVIGEKIGKPRRDKVNGSRQERYPDQQEAGTGGPTREPVVQPPSPRGNQDGIEVFENFALASQAY